MCVLAWKGRIPRVSSVSFATDEIGVDNRLKFGRGISVDSITHEDLLADSILYNVRIDIDDRSRSISTLNDWKVKFPRPAAIVIAVSCLACTDIRIVQSIWFDLNEYVTRFRLGNQNVFSIL